METYHILDDKMGVHITGFLIEVCTNSPFEVNENSDTDKVVNYLREIFRNNSQMKDIEGQKYIFQNANKALALIEAIEDFEGDYKNINMETVISLATIISCELTADDSYYLVSKFLGIPQAHFQNEIFEIETSDIDAICNSCKNFMRLLLLYGIEPIVHPCEIDIYDEDGVNNSISLITDKIDEMVDDKLIPHIDYNLTTDFKHAQQGGIYSVK